MWYVWDVLYVVLYVRVSCFVVHGCAVSRRFINVCYCYMFSVVQISNISNIKYIKYQIALVAEWLRVRLRVRMVRGSTLTVGNFLSLENLNVIIRAIN